MKKLLRCGIILGTVCTLLILPSCGKKQGLQDGYYNAQAAEYSYGRKEYAAQLLDGQGESEIDGISGATTSHTSFQKLAAAVIEQARQGDSTIAVIED